MHSFCKNFKQNKTVNLYNCMSKQILETENYREFNDTQEYVFYNQEL